MKYLFLFIVFILSPLTSFAGGSNGTLSIRVIVLPYMNSENCKETYCEINKEELLKKLNNKQIYNDDNFSAIKIDNILNIVY